MAVTMSAVMAPPTTLTCSSSDVLSAPLFWTSTAPVVTAFSSDASTEPGTLKASAWPVAMPPELGSDATGDCDVTPAGLTNVPNAVPVTFCACTAPKYRARLGFEKIEILRLGVLRESNSQVFWFSRGRLMKHWKFEGFR